MPVPVSGYVKNGFEKVKIAFEENFEKMLQNGATLVKPITKMDWNDTVGYLSDYDGHIIALAQK